MFSISAEVESVNPLLAPLIAVSAVAFIIIVVLVILLAYFVSRQRRSHGTEEHDDSRTESKYQEQLW